MAFTVSQKTLERLEWPQILARLAGHARTPHGRALLPATAAAFARDPAAVRARLAETREAYAILDAGDAPPFGGACEVAEVLARARKGGALAPDELRRVAGCAAAVVATRRFLERHTERAPGLAERVEHMVPCAALCAEIDACIDAAGEVRDAASPALAAARRDARRLAGEIQERLQRLLHSAEVEPHLSDSWSTVRNGRYVLPVRADSRRAVPGIVHDASRSGTTLFVEPQAIVELNNTHKEAELVAEQELRRVLRGLTEAVAEAAGDIERGLDRLGHVDFAFARAGYAREIEAVEPEVADAGVLRLPQLRHPLIDPDECVPNDVQLGDGFSVLVLSGPNAGGKTVTMKSAALALLFSRAGLFVPAQAPARIDAFDALLGDIGDEQDIREHLSTFSAHMANVAEIVSQASPRTLVALDELGVGTDPGEGAAIAQAVLEALADAGARVLVTTHYGLLKELAEADARFANASVAFDAQTLAPTYRLQMGLPGRSSAAAVAARMGMPRSVLERADAVLSRDDRRLDRMLSELSASRASLEHEQREARRLRVETDAVRREYSEKLQRLQQRRERLYSALRDDLDRAFRDAHRQIADVVRELQAGPSSRDAAQARERLLELERETRSAAPPTEAPEDTPAPAPAIDWKRARPGDPVRVEGAGDGALAGLPDRRGRVAVQVGGARVVVPMERVGRAPVGDATPQRRPAAPLPVGGSQRLDLRGTRVDEALDRLVDALDAAAAAGRERLEIVHGVGTGALRAAVHEHLEASPYVTKVLDADPDEGGAGVTFAELGLR